MKWIVATVGAILVTLGAFLGIVLLPVALFPAIYKSMAGVLTMYIVGFTLAIAAGVSSFRATLHQYAKKP